MQVACVPFSVNPYLYNVFQLTNSSRQLAELPAILDSFTPLSQMIIGVEVGGGGEPQKWWVFSRVEVDTARRSHLRPI